MNLSIFSSTINIFKSWLNPCHNIESVLSSSIFLLRQSAIFNPFDLVYHFQDMLQNKKATWQCRHNANNGFFHLLREKMSMLWTTETTTFIRMIARNFIQRKQPFLWFNANNDKDLLWERNPDNYFLSLSWNIHAYHLHSTTSTISS